MERETVPAVADAITNRRRELALDLAEFIRLTGLSRQGLAPLLAGERRKYQERLTLPVCRVLRWTPDSIDRLFAGKPAIPNGGEASDTDPLHLGPDTREYIDEKLNALARAAERMEVAGAEAERWRQRTEEQVAATQELLAQTQGLVVDIEQRLTQLEQRGPRNGR